MRSLSAAVSSLLSSSSFAVVMFCFSSVAQDFVLSLISHQFFLGSLDFHLQIDQLLLQPVGGLHGGFKTGPKLFST